MDSTGTGFEVAFTNLTITGTSPSYTLVFTAPGLAPDTAGNVTRIGTHLILHTEPSTVAASGRPLDTAPVVWFVDANNALVGVPGLSVQANVSGAAQPNIANGLLTTDPTGAATFTNLTLTDSLFPQASYQLVFSTDNWGAVQAAAPTQLAMDLAMDVNPPTNAALNVALNPQPGVHLVDRSGTTVNLTGVQINATLFSGGGTLSGGPATTNASGAATFSGLTFTAGTGAQQLQFGWAGLKTPHLAGTVTTLP